MERAEPWGYFAKPQVGPLRALRARMIHAQRYGKACLLAQAAQPEQTRGLLGECGQDSAENAINKGKPMLETIAVVVILLRLIRGRL